MILYRYHTYGVTIASEWPLPELASVVAPAGAATDLHIRQRQLGDAFALREQHPPSTPDEDIFVRWPSVGLFVMRQGREIHFDPGPDTAEAAIRLILLGVCLGISLHQRGPVVLHGSAVEVNGRALAFMGDKEAGKSTMVGALIQRGHRLIADDLVVLRHQGGRHVLAPGYPSLKIWPSAAVLLGLCPQDMPVLYDQVEKRWMMVGDRFQTQPTPLTAMVMLEKGDGPRIEPVERAHALMRVVEQTYALRFLGKRGATANYFVASAQLVRDVPVVNLYRPLLAGKLDEVVVYVEDWAATLPALA